MSELFWWMVALGLSVCATILAAGGSDAEWHMAVTGAVSIALATLGIVQHHRLIAAGASANAVGGSTARYCGLVWAWGALSNLAVYGALLETRWPEWWHFFLGFSFAAVASMVVARLFDNDAASGKTDAGLLKIGDVLVKAQLVGMIVGIISLFVDNKFPRPVSYADWVGCNVAFFGALAIAALSLNAILYPAKTEKA